MHIHASFGRICSENMLLDKCIYKFLYRENCTLKVFACGLKVSYFNINESLIYYGTATLEQDPQSRTNI